MKETERSAFHRERAVSRGRMIFLPTYINKLTVLCSFCRVLVKLTVLKASWDTNSPTKTKII